MKITNEILNKILQKYFGYKKFTEDQDIQIKNILQEKNTLSIIPTGGGKSLIFQFPSLLLKGTTIVISPFISLMKNQVDKMENPVFEEINKLNKIGIPAAFINSTLTGIEKQQVMESFYNNKLKLLYVSPERFCNDDFIMEVNKVKIPMVVIDEAHLVYQYQNFRSEYLLLEKYIKKIRDNNGKVLISAFTATATKRTENFILKTLGLNKENTFIYRKPYKRDNLLYITKNIDAGEGNSEDLKRKTLLSLVKMYNSIKGSKIIFTTTIKQAKEIKKALTLFGYKTDAYYSDIKKEKKDKIQENFMNNKYDFLVATSAFGTGVDKSDIRCIIHYGIPLSIEQYVQETGRAGRDGKESICILLYSKKDINTSNFLIRTSSGSNLDENMDDFDKMIKLAETKNNKSINKKITNFFE